MAVCYIVGAAPACTPFTPAPDGFVIAADGGQAALARMGVAPHLVVGDFDSSPAPFGVPTVSHPPVKDDTDTALAIAEGYARGYRTFALYGCTGGRPDHAFGAVQTMLSYAKRGCRMFLVGEGMVGTLLVDDTLSFVPSGYVSVFSLSERSEGVTIEGLKYTLTDATLTNDYPLGVSNEGLGGTATVSVRAGVLYLLYAGETLPL